jgi:hypothetical protein
MLDKYYLSTGSSSTSVNANINVTEKRAPTDESVQLLDEMEKKMLKRIIDTVIIDTNEMSAKWVTMCAPMPMGNQQAAVCFTLNGKEYQFRVDIPRGMTMTDSREHIIQELFKEYTRKIAELLMLEMANSDAGNKLLGLLK